MAQHPPCLGFAGLGAMGFGMAANLLRHNCDVVGFDVHQPTTSRFRAAGGRIAASPREAANDVFICMVANSSQVNAVLFDEKSGAVHGLPRNALVLVCSTIPASFIRQVEDRLVEHGREDVDIVDCPVSGGTTRAAQGSLTILAAGRPHALRRADPILRTMSEKLYRIPGGLGAASNVKMINQLLVGSHIVAASEAIGLAAKSGLNTREVFDIIRLSSGNSWAFNNRVPHMLDNDWTPLSALNIFVKDMGIVVSAARDVSFPVPIASTAQQQYTRGASQSLGREDDSGVVRTYLPEHPSLVHEQTRTGIESLQLTPSVTPVEIRKIGVLDSDHRAAKAIDHLVSCGYAIQHHPSHAQVLLLTQSDPERALFGDLAAADRLTSNAVVVIASPTLPETIISIDDRLRELGRGLEVVDAQCLKTDEGGLVVCSGSEPAVASVMPVLTALGDGSRNVRQIKGAAGAGATVALLNQMLEYTHVACAAEAMSFGARIGLDVGALYKIIIDAAGWSHSFESRVPAMLGQNALPQTKTHEAMKALSAFCTFADRLSYPSPMAASAYQMFTFAASSTAQGQGSSDVNVVKFYEMAGASLQPKTEPTNYESVSEKQTLDSLPPEFSGDVVETIQCRIADAKSPLLVILDDDPTGTQTCHDITVLTVWDHATLCKEFQSASRGFFVLTNSRALSPEKAYDLIHKITSNVAKAALETGKEFEIVLRGDSTLRGHIPQEPEAVESVLGKFDGWVIAPFFYQGGRLTIEDVHYVKEGKDLVPAHLTAFAKDASFGYKSSNLRDYVMEKCGSRFSDDDFVSILISDIRKGPEKVSQILAEAPQGCVVIVNAAAESDMYCFAAGLLEAEARGKRFLYRTGAAFVSARLGIKSVDPLTMGDLGIRDMVGCAGGLIVAGSYVPKTTAQLARLRERRGDRLRAIELEVEKLISSASQADRLIRAATEEATRYIRNGEDVLVSTSRKLITGKDSASSLQIGGTVAAALVRVVEDLEVRPRYIIAKGGITASDAATKGLRMKRARVIGQAANGVPLWRCDEGTSRHAGVPYVVFPGNVGDEDALAELVERWTFD